MSEYFFDLKWYGLKLSDVQEPGYGRVELETDDPDQYAEEATNYRLITMLEKGQLDNAPGWVVKRLMDLGKIKYKYEREDAGQE